MVANFKVASNDANLQTLTVNKGTLSPAFSSSVTFYTVDVPKGNSNQTVYIDATAGQQGAVVSGDTGLQALSMGSNLFKVEVLAEDTAFRKTYTLMINRDADVIDSLSQKITATEKKMADTVLVLDGTISSLQSQNDVLQANIDDLLIQLDECGDNTRASFPQAANSVIYPNPTTGIVYIETESDIKVYNQQGTLLLETFGNQIDLSAYPQGLYFLQINGAWAKVVKK